MPVEAVDVPSGDGSCAGDLFVPDAWAGRRRPGIVFGKGFSMVKEASVEEATYLQRAGYVVLSIDYRTFGDSAGEPRGRLFPMDQVEDYRNAMTYLQLRPEVDPKRIGLWGTSFSGGIAIYAAAADRRAKAVVVQIPIVNGRRWMQALRTRDQWEELVDRLEADRVGRSSSGPGKRIRVHGRGSVGVVSAMPSDAEQVAYMDGLRSRLTTWRDDITLDSLERVVEFEPESVIDRIAPRPLCVIALTGYDVVHPVDQVLDAFARARHPKELVLLPLAQFGLHAEPGKGVALQHAIRWFDRHLGASEVVAGV